MPRWSISKLFGPGINYCVRVRAPGGHFRGGSLKINVRKLIEQPFAKHLAQAQAPVGDSAVLGTGTAKKRSYRGQRLSDSLALGGDSSHNRRNPTVGPR